MAQAKIKFSLGDVKVPPLENGDRLTRPEFERRSAILPESQRVELIEGVVYMAAALRFLSHGKPHSQLNAWLATYQIFTMDVEIADAPTVRLDGINEPQPDLALFISPDQGGQVRISEDDYLEGAPELIAEIAASTVSIDLGDKKLAYERNGVQEYLVWRVLDKELDWFRLESGCYVPNEPDADGVLRSRQFAGLWLDREALLAGNMQQVLAVLQRGIASESSED